MEKTESIKLNAKLYHSNTIKIVDAKSQNFQFVSN